MVPPRPASWDSYKDTDRWHKPPHKALKRLTSSLTSGFKLWTLSYGDIKFPVIVRHGFPVEALESSVVSLIVQEQQRGWGESSSYRHGEEGPAVPNLK